MLDLARATKHQTVVNQLEESEEKTETQAAPAQNHEPAELNESKSGLTSETKGSDTSIDGQVSRQTSIRNRKNKKRIMTLNSTEQENHKRTRPFSLTNREEMGGFLEYSGDSEASLNSDTGTSEDLKEFSIPYQENLLHRLERQRPKPHQFFGVTQTSTNDGLGPSQKRLVIKILYQQQQTLAALTQQTDHLIRLMEQ